MKFTEDLKSWLVEKGLATKDATDAEFKDATQKALSRIRLGLQSCIEGRLRSEG